MTETILVIGPHRPARFVLALSALAALRAHHKSARLIGLVTPETQFIARTLPYFDDIWLDPRVSIWDARGTLELRAELRATPWTRIYDLELSRTSRLYFRLLHGWRIAPEALACIPWSGDVAGAALYHDNPRKNDMHFCDRLQDQLRAAGVLEFLPADVSWAARQVREFSAPFRMNQPFAMLCLDSDAGEAWPAERFAALAEWLASRKLTPLLVGFAEHAAVAETITQRCPDAIDITGKAPLIDTVFLSWAAAAAVGAGCAAMHIAAVANCRVIVLCGAGVDPAVDGPRGQRVQVLKRGRLADIAAAEILTLLADLGPGEG
jgi:ADP-heptose:LPS heptosyltransferase